MSEFSNGDIAGERALSQTGTAKRRFTTGRKVAVYGLITAAVVAAIFWRNPPGAKSTTSTTQAQQPGMIGQLVSMDTGNPFSTGSTSAASQPPPQSLAQMLRETLANNKGGGGLAEKAPSRMTSFASAPVVAHDTPPAGAQAPDASGKPGTIPIINAGTALDLTYMLMPAVVLCTLDIAIDTTQPGNILCHTKDAVQSPAKVVLMEKGTTIVGNYSSGLQQGQNRLPAVSAYAITPSGVPVALSAPMTDALGRSGFPGIVDTHFGERFEGALLLLASQGAIGAAQASLQHGNGNSYLNLNTGGVDSAVADTLRNTSSIPPTIRVNQGEVVGLFVTTPVNFAASYGLKVIP